MSLCVLCRDVETALQWKHQVKVKWHSSKYSDPYSEFVLHIYPSNVHTHKPWTHSQSSGQPFMLRLLGRSWGFGALLKGTSVMEKALYIHSPHLLVLPAQDSNSQPFDYESDFLSIRPRLPVGFKPKKLQWKPDFVLFHVKSQTKWDYIE